MPIKHTDFIIQGMFRDTSEHAFDSKFAYENQNLRITADPNSSSEHTSNMYALTNEKGNKYVPIWGLDSTGHNRMDGDTHIFNGSGDMWGVPVGQALLNNKWVVFMVDRDKDIFINGVEREIEDLPIQDTQINNFKVDFNDRIYKLWFNNDKMYGDLLYEGHLNLSTNFPLETLPYYENEQIQKVYWTDGLNQPRLINIEATDKERSRWNDTSFDFVSTINLLNHNVKVTELSTGGVFPSGVVQWYFTYQRDFGPESNIFTQTSLYDLKYTNRGAAPDEVTSQSFRLELTGLDYINFDTVNIYSVIRTSLDGVPNCKLVATLKLSGDSIEYVDNNLTGEAIDPQSLFYKGGEPITAYTFEQKNNTLFLGNYNIIRSYIPAEIRESLRDFAFYKSTQQHGTRYLKLTKSGAFKFTNGVDLFGGDNVTDFLDKKPDGDSSCIYKYKGTLADKFATSNSPADEVVMLDKLSYFKKDNYYRVGLQFQHYTGKWSEVVWLGDYLCTDKLQQLIEDEYEHNGGNAYARVLGYLKLTSAVRSQLQKLVDLGYRLVRPVIIYPNIAERVFLGQGVLCNTLRSSVDTNTVYPDYFFRELIDINNTNEVDNNDKIITYADTYSQKAIFRFGYMPAFESYGDKWYNGLIYTTTVLNNTVNYLNEVHFIQDGTIVDIYSPDAEFDDTLKVYNLDNVTLKKNNELTLESTKTVVEIQTSTIAETSIGVYDWDNQNQKHNFYNKWKLSGKNAYYDWNTSKGCPNGFGEDDSEDKGLDDVTHTNRYLPKTFYPQKLLYKARQIVQAGHYTGGYVWHDHLRNTSTVHNDTLDLDVPSKQATFMAHSYSYIFPVFIWQPSGSICYDKKKDGSSILKSNKTLNYFSSKLQDITVNGSTQELSAECKIMDTFSTEKLFDITLYKSNVDTSLVHGDDYYAYVTALWSDDPELNQARVYKGYNPSSTLFNRTMTMKNSVAYFWNKNDVTAIKSIYRWPSSEYGGFYKWAWEYNGQTQPEGDTFPWIDGSVKTFKEDYPWNVNTFVTSVKYKTVPHITAILGKWNWKDNDKALDSYIRGYAKIDYLGRGYFNRIHKYPSLPIVDIKQDVTEATLFGGYTEAILQRNNFLPCGDTVAICHLEHDSVDGVDKYVANTNIEIIWDKGDVRRQHYECLKTFPYTLEDENSVTEVLDVELETYWNMNGRYDTWKGNPQLSTMPSNWNLMNPVYNQKDNFMTYHGLDLSKFSVNNFPNSFTWTLTKSAGDEVDKWTQITLANTMDLDMNRGQITKIIGLQDNLLCFQPKGISQILYNEREQLSTGSGVPVELSNSGKVGGTRYLSVLSGCNNKWSICKSEKGLYWVDDVNKQIMNFTQQPTNLSDSLGFHSWINDMASLNIWNPLGFNNFVSYFDPYNEDVVFYYKNNALSFSEQLNCFDTFLPYRFVPYYMAFHNSAFTLSDRDSDGKDTYKVWEHFKGDYNYFYVHDVCIYDSENPLSLKCKGMYEDSEKTKPTDFGYEPYFTTLLVNPDMPYDKVFNNMDMRTDMWSKNGELLEETFSHIEVWNEFQWNKSQLIRRTDIPKVHLPKQHSILKKKFRVWYTNIPRDISEPKEYIYKGINQQIPTRGGVPTNRFYNRDRIRNTWMYLKLSKELINNDPVIQYPYISDNKHNIHHIGVSYFI